MKHLLFTVLLVIAATNAAAQTSDPCATQKNTIEINECGKLTLARKDKILNAAYQQLIKKLTPVDKVDPTNYGEVKKYLVEAQRNWLINPAIKQRMV